MTLLLLLLACPKSNTALDDRLGALLLAIDDAWAARDREGMEPVEQALDAARAFAPGNPQVEWRAARTWVGEGLRASDPAERIRWFGRARQTAWSCVRDDFRVAALADEIGLSDALAELPEQRLPCLQWAALAWTRWYVAFGPAAAALDLPVLDAVTERAQQASGRHAFAGEWAGALLAATRTDGKLNPQQAQATLARLSSLEPDPTWGVASLDRMLLIDGADAETLRGALAGKGPVTGEAQGYVERWSEPR